jgi:hypothetical protein
MPLVVKPTVTVAVCPSTPLKVSVVVPAVLPAVTVKVTDAPAEAGVCEDGLTVATSLLPSLTVMAAWLLPS